MGASGIDVDAASAAGSLVVASKQDAYLKQGYFDPEWMIGFLEETARQARDDGYSALRVTGEMTWALGDAPGADRLIEYENELNRFLPAADCVAICQYNRSRFPDEVIRDIIYTHPTVIYGGCVCSNFYFIPPEEFLSDSRDALLVQRMLQNLTGSQQRLNDSEGRNLQLLKEQRLHLNELKQEAASLNALAGRGDTSVTSDAYGTRSLRENAPDVFRTLCTAYADMIEQAVEQRVYRQAGSVSDQIKRISDQMGFLRAGPRDVIDLHAEAMKTKQDAATTAVRQAYITEGRVRSLELMGYLVSHYRRLAAGEHHTAVPGPQKNRSASHG